MSSQNERVDSLNLFTPVLDGVNSPGEVGDVLRSLGPDAPPVWGSGGNVMTSPGPGSNALDAASAGPVYHFRWQGAGTGVVALIAPDAVGAPETLALEIQLISGNATAGRGGIASLLVLLRLENGVIADVLMNGAAPGVEVWAALRPADNRPTILLGLPTTTWQDLQVLIGRVVAGGDPAAGGWTAGWTAELLGDLTGWTLQPAHPVGRSEVLGDAGPGRASHGVGGYSAGGPVSGAITFRLPDEVPRVSTALLVGSGIAGEDLQISCLLLLRRGPAPTDAIDRLDVINLAPTLPPVLRVALDGQGRSVLVVGSETQGWDTPALSLVWCVQARAGGPLTLPCWESRLVTSFAGWAFTALGNLRTIAGSIAGGGGAENHEPGDYLLGQVYDGSLPQRWDVAASVGPTPDLLAARDGNGDLRAVTFIGNLSGVAASALQLQTPRTINGVPFDGTQDIVITIGGDGLEVLTPGPYLVGNPYTGLAPEIWGVDAAVTAEGGTVMARDNSGDAYAVTFHGNLNGLAQEAVALQTARAINGVPFDGTADITLPPPTGLLPLSGGTLSGNLTVPSLNQGPLGGIRNRFINPRLNWWQLGTTFTFNAGTPKGYTADGCWAEVLGHEMTVSREALPIGSAAALRGGLWALEAAVTIGAGGPGSFAVVNLPIEGVRTYAGQPVTVSFDAAADVAGKQVVVELAQVFGASGPVAGGIGRTTLALDDELARYSVTVTLPSGAGVATTEGDHLLVRIFLSGGTGQPVQAGTFTFTDFQLEPGPLVTPFMALPEWLEEQAVKRYQQVLGGENQYEAFATLVGVPQGASPNPRARGILHFEQVMARVPTASFSALGTFRLDHDGSSPLAMSLISPTKRNAQLEVQMAALPVASSSLLVANASTLARVVLDANYWLPV